VYDTFAENIKAIALDPERKKKRWDLISDMEKDLIGIGATCVEDKL